MNGKIVVAIGILADRIDSTVRPDHAVDLTQAALNLAHVKGILAATEKDEKETEASAS